MAGRVEGKVAFVTGGAQGIGWVYAQGLAKEGAKVVVNDVLDCQGPANQLKEDGAEAIGIKGDITDPSAMEAAVKKTVDAFGSLDILLNNAALYATIERGSMFDISLEDWDRVLKVNILGQVVVTKAAARRMKEQKSGKIVNIASAVHDTGIPAFIHYTASKSAVIGKVVIIVPPPSPSARLASRAMRPALNLRCQPLRNPGHILGLITRRFVGSALSSRRGDAHCLSLPAILPRSSSDTPGARMPIVFTHSVGTRSRRQRTRCWLLDGCRPQSSLNTTSWRV